MNSTLTLSKIKSNRSTLLLDTLGIAVLYLIPTLSHLLSLPLYLFEPIRILVVLSILHTNRSNAYFLAVTLPIFSFVIAGHPILFKMLIISAELLVNVWLFYKINKSSSNPVLPMIISIALSKVFYYILQYILILFTVLSWEQVEHPILPQIIVVLGLGAYAFIISIQKKSE